MYDSDADAVTIADLTIRYGEVTALDGVDLAVRTGEVLGIVGPNGAGKTSLLECAEGLRVPSRGRISVAGMNPVTDRVALARIVGTQLQHMSYPARVRVAEICRLYASFYDRPADWGALLEEFGLAEHRRSWIVKLSGGERQRLSLVLALIGNPTIAFLDELTTGLDPAARRHVWGRLRARNAEGLTVLITSHFMEEVEYLCDRVAVLVAGRLVATDSVSALVRDHARQAGRLLVEASGADLALRQAIADVNPTVRVNSAGNKLFVEADSPEVLSTVESMLTARGEIIRQSRPCLDDAYLKLTGHSAQGGGDVR